MDRPLREMVLEHQHMLVTTLGEGQVHYIHPNYLKWSLDWSEEGDTLLFHHQTQWYTLGSYEQTTRSRHASPATTNGVTLF